MSLWCPASSFHISQPMESSTPFPGASNNSKQSSVQSGSRLSVKSSSTPCFHLRYHGVSPLHACTLLHPKPMEWIYLQGFLRLIFSQGNSPSKLHTSLRSKNFPGPFLPHQEAFVLLSALEHPPGKCNKEFNRIQKVRSHFLGFRVERKTTHHHSFQVHLMMNQSSSFFLSALPAILNWRCIVGLTAQNMNRREKSQWSLFHVTAIDAEHLHIQSCTLLPSNYSIVCIECFLFPG